MMDVTYINHKGQEINLSQWPTVLLDPEKLVETTWSYSTLNNGSIDSFFKESNEKEVTLQIFADSEEEYNNTLNNITEITEVDVNSCIQGTLKIGKYYLQCYITGWKYEEWEEDFYATNKQIKIRSDKWIWRCTNDKSFEYVEKKDETGHGYPYGYDYDYSLGSGCGGVIENTHYIPCDFILEIKGYAKKPSVTIGNNTYLVNVTVQVGETLIINTQDKTIKLVKNNQIEVNVYSRRDMTKYFWEKVNPGINNVYWNGSYDMKITLLEERSEPKW